MENTASHLYTNTFISERMGIGWHITSDQWEREREREIFYLTTHSTHFIYGYMASDIWLRTILIVRKETRCHHIGYSYWLTARVLLYAPSHRQDNTYHSLCYTSRGALAGTRNSSMGPPMKDRSDDPPHHERTLYLWAMSRSGPMVQGPVWCKVTLRSIPISKILSFSDGDIIINYKNMLNVFLFQYKHCFHIKNIRSIYCFPISWN